MVYQYNALPKIKENQFDSVAEEFLDIYCPEALITPMPVPIKEIAAEGLHLDLKFYCLSEEFDIMGEMVFSDGSVVVYDPQEGVYDEVFLKRGTMIIDPQGYTIANSGCVNNTIAHECVHWFKHRTYQAFRSLGDKKLAKICRCPINDLPINRQDWTDEEWMEWQARGISPRILLPKLMVEQKFEEIYSRMRDYEDIGCKHELIKSITSELATFFAVSYSLVTIRMSECGLKI